MSFTELWHIFIAGYFPITSVFCGSAMFLAIVCSAFSKQPVRITFPVILAFGMIGGITGFSVGASRIPVVGVVLPAMLTLFSGVLGYMFSKENLKAWRLVIPFCLVILSVNSFFGLFAGGQMRGKHEEYERNYNEWLLKYQHVELEAEKQKILQK